MRDWEMKPMKIFAALSTSALFLLLVSVAPAYAQEERHDEASPAAHKDEAKPAHQEASPAHEGEAKPEHREGDKASKQDEKARKQEVRPEDREARHDGAQPAQKSERAEASHNGG